MIDYKTHPNFRDANVSILAFVSYGIVILNFFNKFKRYPHLHLKS